MTRIAASQPVAPVRRPVAPVKPATAPAPAAPQAPAKAQAPQAADRPKKFKDLEGYQAYVLRSAATGLPAARQAVRAAQGQLTAAEAALAAKKREVSHAPLAQALAKAEADLVAAQFPLRPQGAAKKAEAQRLQGEIGAVMRELAEAQRDIAAAEGRKAARSRDFWWGDNSNDTGWDVAADVLGSIGDASAVSSGNRRVKAAIDKKVALEQQILALTLEAARLDQTPGDPAKIEAARATRDGAKAAFDGAETGIAKEAAAADAARRELGTAQGGLDRLEAVKKDLTDYGKQFGFFTRVKLKLSNWGWRKQLDAFWQSKGL